MTRACHIMDDGTGNLFIMPGCWGTVDRHADTRLGLRRIIETHCHCDRRPVWKRGAKQRLKRLEFRLKVIQKRIDQLCNEAYGMLP